MMESNHFPPLSDATFRLIRDLIQERSGIFFKDNNKFILERRLQQRLRALHISSYEQYYYYMLYDPKGKAEEDELFNLITTNETYFFREEQQLKAFSEEIVPSIIQTKPSLRIWSAGCSTGEEPYTIAMLLVEKGIIERTKVQIFASDISQDALRKARTGIYREYSFRQTPEYYRRKYFDPLPDGTWQVKEQIKELVSFGKINLLDEQRIALLGYLDVIFCRNVIIYFDMEAKKKVIELLHRRLYPGGYLLLGHSESLISLSTQFKLRHLKHDMVYQK